MATVAGESRRQDGEGDGQLNHGDQDTYEDLAHRPRKVQGEVRREALGDEYIRVVGIEVEQPAYQ